MCLGIGVEECVCRDAEGGMMTENTKTYAEQYVDEANDWEQARVEDDGAHFDLWNKPGYSVTLTTRYDPGDGERWRYAFDDGSYLELDVDSEWGAGLLSEFGYGEDA